ncbi:MAG: lysophospholipid acyltransferase family protein, partial [Thermodesulfobacteriota bacterium]|nr:lysophospholipid acyltransferase family protein [Thermodesulfobacteriota bacterium]
QIIFEIGWSLRLESKDFQKYFNILGLSNYRNAYEKGRGVLLLTAHIGNWELLSIIMAMAGYPVNVLYRPLDFFPLDQFFVMARGRFGAELIPAARSMKKILRSLKYGKAVGMLMDQNVDWYEGVFVDFFGHRACTNKGMALLARRTEASVIPVFLVREKSGFRAEFGSEVPLIKTEDIRKDLESNTQQYNRIIEDFIRQYPDQWFWVHQRWKTKPYCQWPRNKEK